MLIIVIAAMAGVIAAVVVFVITNLRRIEARQLREAAYTVIKEQQLADAISNGGQSSSYGKKIMISLKWKDTQKRRFVFNPEYPVRIGRDPERNDVCIYEGTVSQQQCMIFLSQQQLWIQDMNSSNGTWLRRGLRKKRVDGYEVLRSGDILLLGGYQMQITIFLFDVTYL